MLGCQNCQHCFAEEGPYITAYEIAVKNGFVGTEEDWVKTLQSVYVTKVKSKGAMDWECTDKYADLLELYTQYEVHLLTPEGRTAFCNGLVTDGATPRIRFQTLSYYDDDVEGNVYEVYELYSNENGTFLLADAYAPGLESITKNMLATAVQNELDGAVQSSDQAAKDVNQTQAVGIDSNGQLWVYQPTDYVKDSVQPTKDASMTNEVGVDGQGQLWAQGYQKPPTGIPATDLAEAVQNRLANAGFKSIAFTVNNNVYSYYDSDFAWTNVDDLIQQIQNGANVRLVILGSNNTYPAVHFQGAESLARVYFSGPTVTTGGSYGIAIDAFELAPSSGSVSLTRVYHEDI